MATPRNLLITAFLGGAIGTASLAWRSARPPVELSELSQRQLAALGYVDFEEVSEREASRVGVTLWRPELSQPGYNLFNTRSTNRALLIDADGSKLHEWHAPTLEGTWHHIELAPNGDLLVLAKDGYLARLAWDSSVRWKYKARAHHDIELGSDGAQYVLDRAVREGEGPLAGTRIVSDGVVELDAAGRPRRRIDLFDLLRDWVTPELQQRAIAAFEESDGDRPFDLFHTNSLERIDRDLAGLPTTGAFLLSALTLDLVAIVDLARPAVLWAWGPGDLDGVHHPRVLRNGNLLVFENGTDRGWSRIVEIDPVTRRIVWEYGAARDERFFSPTRGGVQELANGNLLITESDPGRVFEIVRSGPHEREIVWEFFNPDIVERDERLARGTIYRMTRIDPSLVDPRLGRRHQ